jgi:tRNA C32,U32 (ribose-2'-O)-methylase TrmJ
MKKQTLKEFLDSGGRLEAGNSDHIEMYHEALRKEFKTVDINEKTEYEAICRHCLTRSEWDESEVSCIREIFKKITDIPQDMIDCGLEPKELYKCKKCKKVSYL